MRKLQYGHKIDSVFALIIFSAFAAAVLMVLILGAHIYKDIALDNEIVNDQRIAVSYIEAKVRHNDTLDNIYVDGFQGYTGETDIDTLYLEEDYGDLTYHTMIYLFDGWIRELYCEKGLALNPEDGTKIIEAQALRFAVTEETGLLHITCTDKNGLIVNLDILPRCKGGIAL